MKIGSTTENTLITNIEGDGKSKFKIAATGKAFQILSSSLYSYKTKAVVREIGCNAYDAHIDAGTTATPFLVTLPCKEDPHFTVRDFGIGLAEDKFVEIYTTYFGSSKADSNDHTGGLGLGSKTPFIMSKSFTVHSYYNGTDYMWHSFVNDNGEPDVMMLHSKPTTEPNGLKVIVPIGQGMSDTEKTALFRDFKSEAEEVYRWFDTPPTVTVNGAPVIIKPRLHDAKINYQSIKLTGVENTSVYYHGEQAKTQQGSVILVKMGNVVYPYNLKDVKSLDRFGGNIVQTQRIIDYVTGSGRLNPTNYPLVIEVGMGDVDIAPSRETLSLNNTTELTIINALVRFIDMFFAKVQHGIDNAKNTFEKYQALYLVPALGGKNFTIDGKEVDPFKQTPTWLFGTAQETAGVQDKSLRWFDTNKHVIKYRRQGTRGILPAKTSFKLEMYGANIRQRHVILVDTAYKGELRAWVNANAHADAAVVVVYGEDIKGGKSVPRPLTAAEMAPFLEDGHPQVIKFSQLKVTPTITSTTRSKTAGVKVSNEDAIVLGRTDTSYNYFTVGNSTMVSVDKILKEFDPKAKEIAVYIAFVKKGDTVLAELNKPGQGGKDEKQMVDFSYWSRAQGTATNWQAGTDFMHEVFHRAPSRLHTTHFKVTIDGKDYVVPLRSGLKAGVRQIVLSREAYDEIVDNPDYPHIYSVDRAVRELVIPTLPTAVEVHAIDEKYTFFGGKHTNQSTTRRLAVALGLHSFCKFQDTLATKLSTDESVALSNIKSQVWVKQFGYDKLISGKVVTYTYSFPSNLMDRIITAAEKEWKTPELEGLLLWWKTGGRDYDKHFATGYYNNSEPTVNYIIDLLGALLKKHNYNATTFDDFCVACVEKTRKVT